MSFELPENIGHWRNRIDLTPNVCLVEVTEAQRITAKSVWRFRLITSDQKYVGGTRNTRKWGAPKIEAWVSLPTYNYAEVQVDPTEDVLAVRFLTTLAKEFWP